MDIKFTYRYDQNVLPDVAGQLNPLWRTAILLDQVGLPIADWCPPADSPENALRNHAFEDDGPSNAAIAIFKEKDKEREEKDVRSMVIWNGVLEEGSILMNHTLAVREYPSKSSFSLQSTSVPVLMDKSRMVQVIKGLLAIWPAPFISITDPPYDVIHKVFDDRPGVGWMLYLPKVIKASQVPEAQELIPVEDSTGKQKGTIVVSILDEPFSVQNEEHIKVATSIEIRLVEQDLLPRRSEM
ncbi:immunity 52 family protein [Herbaspirillum sp. GW103]|uniref:immunity 52 family protein n=1 Tax=Herbaspirillum sp. GW103 TaxID=1175306 RepID=UPI00054FD5C4|nr:immunity 52 family protein [Herbaspirillum sp. GW103]